MKPLGNFLQTFSFVLALSALTAPTATARTDGYDSARVETGEKRIALVIGNGAYAESPLSNALNDAKGVKAALQKLDFQVIYLENADLAEMDDAVHKFIARLQPDSEGLFYFSGHGAQADGANYLIPLRADIANKGELKARAYNAGIVLDNMRERGNRFNLVILDACRDNPFKGFKSAVGGLTGMSGPTGTLIAFASAENTPASNNKRENNSVYTKHLLRHIAEPGLKIEDMWKKVRQGVSEDTDGEQIPWENGSLMGDFCFAGCADRAESAAEKKLRVAEDRIRQLELERQQPKTESVYGIEMVKLPSGTFQMGCGPKDGTCDDDEKPPHPLTVPAFAMAKTEITQGQWKAVMGSAPPELAFKDCGEDCPVENVSWDDVQKFIVKLNTKTGGHYRLPSEAEWEYACRAGQATLYCGGNDPDAVAWYDGNSGSKTHPVAGKQHNAFGLYDMSGNVWEWVQDCYHDSYAGRPDDGTAWQEDQCADRVLRGGSWSSRGRDVRSAYRGRNVPGRRDLSFGFRLALGQTGTGQ